VFYLIIASWSQGSGKGVPKVIWSTGARGTVIIQNDYGTACHVPLVAFASFTICNIDAMDRRRSTDHLSNAISNYYDESEEDGEGSSDDGEGSLPYLSLGNILRLLLHNNNHNHNEEDEEDDDVQSYRPRRHRQRRRGKATGTRTSAAASATQPQPAPTRSPVSFSSSSSSIWMETEFDNKQVYMLCRVTPIIDENGFAQIRFLANSDQIYKTQIGNKALTISSPTTTREIDSKTMPTNAVASSTPETKASIPAAPAAVAAATSHSTVGRLHRRPDNYNDDEYTHDHDANSLIGGFANNSIVCFTDGSRLPAGGTGAAAVICVPASFTSSSDNVGRMRLLTTTSVNDTRVGDWYEISKSLEVRRTLHCIFPDHFIRYF
jgi:hypothetical protein